MIDHQSNPGMGVSLSSTLSLTFFIRSILSSQKCRVLSISPCTGGAENGLFFGVIAILTWHHFLISASLSFLNAALTSLALDGTLS